MIQKIIYAVFLIAWSIYLKYLGKTEIEVSLNIIIIILLFILYKILDKNKRSN